MAEIAVSIALFLVEKVLSSLNQVPAPLRTKVRGEVQDIKDSLKTMQAYFGDMRGIEGSEVLEERVKQVRIIAYAAEDVLDEIMLHLTHRYHSHKISKKAHELGHAIADRFSSQRKEISSKMEDIKRRIDRFTALDPLCRGGGGRGFTISGEGTSSSSRAENSLFTGLVGDDFERVGYAKPLVKLVNQLKSTEPRQTTVSLVGPCGSGKSVLANNVYSITIDEVLFACYAWVQVSQSPKIEEILCSMLKQFCASRDEPIPHGSADTKTKLRSYLQRKRYVVFLDDLWSKEDWESIKNALPNGSNGSRIVVTTRNLDVASFCVESTDYIHNITGLSWPEAWQLFCKKAFQAEKCPPQLVDWSQKIVKRCEGNPHAIASVGTLLSKKKQKVPTEWERMHHSLLYEVGTDSSLSIINKLLASYKDLPWNLRSCFLYFCLFPEDYSPDRRRLVRLWIAEGFVMKEGRKTLEEVAEDYLKELVDRNLVHATTMECDGRVRDCRVLNLDLEFIIQKSEEENFASILAEPGTSSSEKVRRLSIHNALNALRHLIDLSSVRSMFFFKTDDISPSEITDILRSLVLLKVLDLRDFPDLDKFPEDIFRLTLLRYLCMRNTNIKEVPKSIEKLLYLETLDLKQTNVTKLPEGILRLHNLRHLLVYRYNVTNYATWHSVEGVEMPGGIGALTNLQKLSLIKSDKHNKIVKELGALTQLRKLGLTGLKGDGGKHLCASIQKMAHLSTLDVSSTSQEESLELDGMHNPPPLLQRLYLKGHLKKFPEWISKLGNLFKISLKWSRLESIPLQILQELPNLMELEMVDAFTGGELVFEARRFEKLEVLQIEKIDQLHTVVVQEGAMPVLRKLTLCKCVKLEMLPLGIDNLTQVEELLLYEMPVEFTGRLQKSHEDRNLVSHIHVIHSFTLGNNGSWSLENLHHMY